MSADPLFLPSGFGELPKGSVGRMHKVCAWCNRDMGTIPCDARMDGAESHGMCQDCRDKQVVDDVTAESFPCGFVDIRELARICGLGACDLYGRFRPNRWRSGTEFVCGSYGIGFREAFLGELVGELAVSGKIDAAGRLLCWLTRDQAPHGIAGQAERVPPPSPRRSWMADWEDANG